MRGQALGGRRAQVVLVALALAGQQLSADRLASIIWEDDLPATWRAALRGSDPGIRKACVPLGGGEQQLIATAPGGYRLAPGVGVDVDIAAKPLPPARTCSRRGGTRQRSPWPSRLPPHGGQPTSAGRGRRVDLPVPTGCRCARPARPGARGDGRRRVRANMTGRSPLWCSIRLSDPLDERAHRAADRRARPRGRPGRRWRGHFEQCRSILGVELGIDPCAVETVQVYLAALGEPAEQIAAARPGDHHHLHRTRRRRPDRLTTRLTSARPGHPDRPGRGGQIAAGLHIASRRARFRRRAVWVSLRRSRQDALGRDQPSLSRSGWESALDDAALAAWPTHLAPLGRVLLVLRRLRSRRRRVASLAVDLLARPARSSPIVTTSLGCRSSIEGERIAPPRPSSRRWTARRERCCPQRVSPPARWTGSGRQAASCASTAETVALLLALVPPLQRAAARAGVGRGPAGRHARGRPRSITCTRSSVKRTTRCVRSCGAATPARYRRGRRVPPARRPRRSGRAATRSPGRLRRRAAAGFGSSGSCGELAARGPPVGRPLRTALALRARRRLAPVLPWNFSSTQARSAAAFGRLAERCAAGCPKTPAPPRRRSRRRSPTCSARSARCSGLPLAGRAEPRPLPGARLPAAPLLRAPQCRTKAASGWGRFSPAKPSRPWRRVRDLCAWLPELLVGRYGRVPSSTYSTRSYMLRGATGLLRAHEP